MSKTSQNQQQAQKLLEQSRQLIDKKKYDEALKVLKEAQQKWDQPPLNSHIHASKALIYMYLEEYMHGVDESEEAICEDPTNQTAYTIQASCLKFLKKFTQAKQQYRKAYALSGKKDANLKKFISMCDQYIKNHKDDKDVEPLPILNEAVEKDKMEKSDFQDIEDKGQEQQKEALVTRLSLNAEEENKQDNIYVDKEAKKKGRSGSETLNPVVSGALHKGSKDEKDDLLQVGADTNFSQSLYLVSQAETKEILRSSNQQEKKEKGFQSSVMLKEETDLSYDGPKFQKGQLITQKLIVQFINWFKAGKVISKNTILYILQKLKSIHSKCQNVVALPFEKFPKIHVVGDTHGQFFDMLEIFRINGYPHMQNPYLFNGDFVDRGAYGVENFITLALFKLYDSNCIHFNRGNHECRYMNLTMGFRDEVLQKYDQEVYVEFESSFDQLPLAHVINNKVLVLHGGIPCFYTNDEGNCVTIDRINKIDRKREIPETENNVDDGIFLEILWNDPWNTQGWDNNNNRGGGCWNFGPDKTKEFVDQNNIDLIIRSHENPRNMLGYEEQAGQKAVTVFSCPNYCGISENLGAYITIEFKEANKFSGLKYGNFKSWTGPTLPCQHYSSLNAENESIKIKDYKIIDYCIHDKKTRQQFANYGLNH